MAQVTLQAVVNFDQVNQLQKIIKDIDGTKIKIDTGSYTKAVQDSEKAKQAVIKTQQAQAKANEAAAKAEREIAKATTEQLKSRKELVRIDTEKEKKSKAALQTEREVIKNQREQAKLERESEAAQRKATQAVREGNKEVKQQGLLYDILGRSVSSFIARMTIYRGVYAGIRAITNGFQEALQTLKAVDTELVAVRKVTGFDQYQMADVEAQAYNVATKYGASAVDYTAGVAAFARAGYKELSGDLAELAQKTQIVGDTTADIANQFLLSMDAAYKYQGSVEKLNRILDISNEIDNKWATSIEKLAEGMGIVAPVAAQLHVTEDELVAMLGTITAVTQRSGSEAARALRSILINLTSDVNAVFEETNGEITYAIGEIDGLRDIVMEYAGDLYKAAEAQGKIVNPAEVIEAMVKAAEQGRLTEQKLYSIVTDESGKLRAAQMWALIQNWNTMYKSMLNDAANAAGSADKEIANAMDSWARKTEVLKNTWTQFVKTGLDSKFFKGALDALTWIVNHLDTLPGTLARIGVAVAALKIHSIAKELSGISAGLIDVEKDASKAAKSLSNVGVSAKSLNVAAGIIGGLALAWTAYSAIRAEIDRKHQERVQQIYEDADAAQQSAEHLIDLSVELSKAESGTDSYNTAAQNLAQTLGTDLPAATDEAIKKLRELTEEQLKASAGAANTALITAEDEYLRAAGFTVTRQRIDVPISSELNDRINGILGGLQQSRSGGLLGAVGIYQDAIDVSTVENAVAYRKALEEINAEINEYVRQTDDRSVLDSEYYKSIQAYLAETSGEYDELIKRQQALSKAEALVEFENIVHSVSVNSKDDLDALIGVLNTSKKYSEDQRTALIDLALQYYDFTEAVDDSSDGIKKNTDELYANQKALEANATSEERAAAAKKDAEAAARKLTESLFDESGALSAIGVFALEADENLAGMVKSELDAQLAAKQANYSALVAQLAMVGITAEQAAQQIFQISVALSGGVPGVAGAMFGAFMVSGGGNSAQALLNAKQAEIKRLMSQISAVSAYVPSSSGGSGGGSSSGGSRSSGSGSGGSRSSSSTSTSTEDTRLVALRDRVSLLKSELSLMQARGDSEEDQISKMREIMAALEAERKYLASIKGDQVTINGLAEDWWNYQNKITDLQEKSAEAAQKQAEAVQDALEATIALANAERQRSVRVYNAATGQWEYTADPAKVASARESYNNAMAGLTDADMPLYNAKLSEWQASLLRQYYAMYGSYSPTPGDIPAAATSNLSTLLNTVNNGATYNFGGITLTEAQAQSMTVYDLARLSASLGIFNRSV